MANNSSLMQTSPDSIPKDSFQSKCVLTGTDTQPVF